MDLDAALDSVFVQTLPHLRFRTSGATIKPNTYYNCEEPVVWNCHPHIPGTAPPRPGLPGLVDQMSLLCPSTTYVLLPSDPFNELYGDDIELLLDVAETLKRIHDTLNVDMYIVLIFKRVAPIVCQQYAHLFQADFALQGCVGNLIYQSLLYDLETPHYHIHSPHLPRHPALTTQTSSSSPLPRCRSLTSHSVPAPFDPAVPLKVAWKGSIYSTAHEQYSGFRFLHASSVGMPMGPVTIASHSPLSTNVSLHARARANFVISLDITSCEKTIDMVESWRSLNLEVVFEYDQKFFVASWVPPRGCINHWHITASSLHLPSPNIIPTVALKPSADSLIPSENLTPLLAPLPSDVVDLPVLSLKDMYKMSVTGNKTRSELFGQKKGLDIKNENQTSVGALRKTAAHGDISVFNCNIQSSCDRPRSSILSRSEAKSKRSSIEKRAFRSIVRSQSSHTVISTRNKRNTAKSRHRRRFTKIDPLLVAIAMRQSFPNLVPVRSRAKEEMSNHLPKDYSWSHLGCIASDFDAQDLRTGNSLSSDNLSPALHGVEYQDKDAIAAVENAILISGTEFANASIKCERISQVTSALKQLQFD
ncbi:unnamed protein product [Agarophyton chilense]